MAKLKDHRIKVHDQRKHDWMIGEIKVAFECDECSIEFDSGENLRKHMENVHDPMMNVIKIEEIETQDEKEEQGEVVEKLFLDRYYGNDGNNEPTGSSIRCLKAKKGDFTKAFNELKLIWFLVQNIQLRVKL